MEIERRLERIMRSIREIEGKNVPGLSVNVPDNGALSSSNFPNDMRRIDVGDVGRVSHSRHKS
jgi:hypothetical protein